MGFGADVVDYIDRGRVFVHFDQSRYNNAGDGGGGHTR